MTLDTIGPRRAGSSIRSPLVPTLMATVAGPGHQIFKQTPMHQEQEKAGAIFRRVGGSKKFVW